MKINVFVNNEGFAGQCSVRKQPKCNIISKFMCLNMSTHAVILEIVISVLCPFHQVMNICILYICF